MTTVFYLGAALMLLLASALVFILPMYWRHSNQGESSIDWLRLRQEELAETEELDTLLTDAEVRVLDELQGMHSDKSQTALDTQAVVGKSQPGSLSMSVATRWFVVIALCVGSWLIYSVLGSLDDVRIAQQLDNLADADPDAIPAVIADIEARVLERPKNSDYLSLLGEYYTAQERHGQALRVYRQLVTLMPESPEILARAAQADFLNRGRVLSTTAKRWAESALAADPNQRTALGTLGMAAFESKDYAGALEHWEGLLRFEAPGSPGHEMMTSVIAEARRRLGGDAIAMSGVQDETQSPTLADELGVTVRVSAPEGTTVAPSATVFVIARPAGSAQRMPTAVVKRTAAMLPLTVRLNDSTAMAGQQISTLEAVDIEVQVNPSGQPGRGQAAWLGEASDIKPASDAAVAITLYAVSP